MDQNPPQPQDEKEFLKSYEGDDKIVSSLEMKDFLDNHPQNIVHFNSGIPTLDHLVEGFEGGELIVVSGPTKMGKTSVCQTFTKNFAEKDIKSLWFSYEMPMRQFLHKFGDNPPLFYLPRKLKGRADVWLRERMLEAKLKYGVRAVFIDHLHFLVDMIQMRSPSLEIGSIVRKLKRTAMEFNIVIFLIAHTGKIKIDEEPGIDSPRDCLPSGQRIYSNGSWIQTEKLKKGDSVISMGSIKELQNDKVLDVWNSGEKDIYKLTTRTGRNILASDGHKFYAIDNKGIKGWTRLKDLVVGQKIAIVKEYPNINRNDITKEQSLLLGWIIGDGHITKEYCCELTASTIEEALLIKKLADKGFGLNTKISPYKDKRAFRVYLSSGGGINNLARWLRKLKFNPVGKDKYVPDFIFKQSKKIIGMFLSGLFQADGYIGTSGEDNTEAVIRLDSISEKLIDGVFELLPRVGIVGFKRKQSLKSSGFRTKNSFIYQVAIYGRNILKFGKVAGFYCYKKDIYNRIIASWNPKENIKESDIFLDRVKSIEYVGKQNTFDISVRGHHCSLKNNSFCVNNIVTHNSSFVVQECDSLFTIHRLKDRNTGEYSDEAKLIVQVNRRTGVMSKPIILKMVNGFFYEKMVGEEINAG
jgi:intein/homing endonuclease